jgi:hypothetical protein
MAERCILLCNVDRAIICSRVNHRSKDGARTGASHRLDRHMSGQIVGRDTTERIEERGLEAARLRDRDRLAP